MITFTSVMSSLLAVALAIFIAQLATELDKELNACGTGVFKDGRCQCVSPYTGTHCELVDCGFGELIDSQFLVDSITTPHYEDGQKITPGCKCDAKFWGYNCANCTTKSSTYCKGFCKDNYYGARCDILCKEASAEDAQGIRHKKAGGVYNFFIENTGGDPFGLCQYDGSVKCRDGRAGPNCQHECKDCVYGSCNLDDGTCDCFDGYYGELCDMTCPGRCSGKNGVCQPDGKCKCEPGFTGPVGNNSAEINDCSLECCVRNFGTDIGRVHGECKTGGGCECDTRWSGPECDCNAEITCGGRGVCSEGKCLCSSEFQGARCEMCNDTRVGPFCQYERYQCPSSEMVNGEFVAVNSHGDYACKCSAGFMGDHCEMCTPSAYPKSGPAMCTYIVPASLCNRGQVKDDFAGSGVMCDCEMNFDSNTDCQNCKIKYFGPDCDIFCDVQCSNSGGTCVNYPEPGCLCPPGKTNLNGECVVCGGDSECVHGECFRGRCQCDPGYYGDDCSVSPPVFNDKVCNGYTPVLKFETATCDTSADCTSTDSPSLANRQVAYRAQQYGREMFCHRMDTPLELKDETGCCVDSNSDGKCDKDPLPDQTCANGDIVVDICNERVLEGEVNVFEWCLSKERNCTKNGECVDPELCQNRCDLGLSPEEWVGKWERDHIESMGSIMSEPWKFPTNFSDPYDYRKSYIYENPCPATHPYLNGPFYGDQYWCYTALPSTGPCNMHDSGVSPPEGGSWGTNQPACVLNTTSTLPVPALDADINDICVSGADYDTCRDYLIPDARVFNMTHMYVDEWKPLPTFETCKFGRYLFATGVNGTKTVALEEPMYAGRIEVISDPRTGTAFARYQNGNESYPNADGDANTMIDSITFYGRGNVEVIVYNYTTDDCAEFIRKSAYHFDNCKRIKFHELDYRWSAFCEWRLTASVQGGFDQRCYDQSKVCAGCEDYQEGCEGLPLKSEHEAPMPPPCNTYWDNFCDTYLNETAKPEGYCAYAECECDGYALGGDACNLQCPVPQFTGTEAPCGADMDPPWGRCDTHIGAIAFGFEQGQCDCFNGGSPSVGCAQVCEGEQDCSPDVDTPYSFVTFNCSDIADVQSIEVLSETEQRCHVNLRDSVCNYWRGRCECATPFTAFTKLEEPMYFNEGSYRISLMQGYEIDEYAPFVKYVPAQDSILRLMKKNRLCANEYIYPAEQGLLCVDQGVKKKNTDWTTDNEGKRCKDYTAGDCGGYFLKDSGTCDQYITTLDECEAANTALGLNDPDVFSHSWTTHPRGCSWNGAGVTFNTNTNSVQACAPLTNGGRSCICKGAPPRYDNKIPSAVACEKNSQYDLEDMTKEECLAFGTFERSTSTSDSDASDTFDEGYDFKTGYRVFDFGKEEILHNLEIVDIGGYCQNKVPGVADGARGYGCDAARMGSLNFYEHYCDGTASNLQEGHASYLPKYEIPKLYWKTCCKWTGGIGAACVDNGVFKAGQFVVEQLDASSMAEAFSSNAWSFVDFVSHGNNLVNIKSRFVRIRGIADAIGDNTVKVRPHLTTTSYLVSDTKQGCIKDENGITYYDFKPDVYISEKVECSYTFRTYGTCDVSYSKGMMGVRECAEACREDERVMFTMVSGECMCAADSCDDFTTSSDKMYYINDNDACGYEFKFKGSCSIEEVLPRTLPYGDIVQLTTHCPLTPDIRVNPYSIASGYQNPGTDFESRKRACYDACLNRDGANVLSSISVNSNYWNDGTVSKLMLIRPDGFCWCSPNAVPPDCDAAAVTVWTGYNIYRLKELGGDYDDKTTCRNKCHEKGYPSFSMPCKCVSHCTESGNEDIYHIQSGYTSNEFIEVKTKSCEHFGHKTINSKDLCRRGSLVLGYDYSDPVQVYAKATDLTPASSVDSVAECKERCGRMFKRFAEVTTTGVFTELDTQCSEDLNKIKDAIPSDRACLEEDCSYITPTAIYSDCEPQEGGTTLWKKVEKSQTCACSDTLAPNYGVVTGNTCGTYITTLEECQAAVDSLGLEATGPFTPATPNQVRAVSANNAYPPGCFRYTYSSSNYFMFNPDLTNGKFCVTPWSAHCICIADPADPATGVMLHAPLYFIKDSGTCDEYITTVEECEAARTALGLNTGTISTPGWPDYTRGCVVNTANTAMFNTATDMSDCGHSSVNCICKKSAYKSVYETASPNSAKGCNGGVYNKDPSNVECENCICQKGLSTYKSDFVEVKSKTCEDHGFLHITTLEVCLEALSDVSFDFKNLAQLYFTQTPQYTDVPRGCAKHPERPFSLAGAQMCTEDKPCMCTRRPGVTTTVETSDRFVMKTSGTCSNHFEITTREECLAAAAIFGILKDDNPGDKFTNHQSGARCGVWNKYVHFGDVTTQCSEVYPCICRLEPPPTVFVAGNCDDFGLEDVDDDACEAYAYVQNPCPVSHPDLGIGGGIAEYTIKDSGTCDEYITTSQECEAARTALGLSDTSVSSGNFIYARGCVSNTGGADVRFNTYTGDDRDCGVHNTNCICKTTTSRLCYKDGDTTSSCTMHGTGISPPEGVWAHGYVVKDSGTCDEYITTSQECEAAGTALGLAFQWAHSYHLYAPGCLAAPGGSIFNTNADSTGVCGTSNNNCICKTSCEPDRYFKVSEGTMPQNKCLYVNGEYYFNEGTSSEKCSDRVPCVCKGKSTASIGSCPEGTSRKYGFSQICFPTAKSTPKADREIIKEYVNDKYKIEELGSGMCAPDHDLFFHNRDNPYRVSDDKNILNADECKEECLKTEGCTGFSFSTKPTYNYRSVEIRDNRYIYNGDYSYTHTNNKVLGNGIRITGKMNAVECMQHCEESHNRESNLQYIPNSVSGIHIYAYGHTATTYGKNQCTCVYPHNQGSMSWTGYSANYNAREHHYTASENTCVLSTDGCDKPVLLGDGKCKFGVDYYAKTMDQCEQLCIDDKFCRTFSWRLAASAFKGNVRIPNCRVSGRECHYSYHRVIHSDEFPDNQNYDPPEASMEDDYVLLLVGKMDQLGDDTQTNSPVCRGDCDAGECGSGFTCYERNGNFPPPPGCYNRGGFSKSGGTDYCVYDEYMEGTALKKELIDTSTYEYLGNGYCSAYRYLQTGPYPDVLASDKTLYDPDRRKECMNRCLYDYPKAKSFFTKNVNGVERCACVADNDHCDSRSYPTATAYKSYLIGSLLPQVPTEETCEDNGMQTIWDEDECVQAGSLVLPDDTENLLFEVTIPSQSTTLTIPSGCYYHKSQNKLMLNTDRSMSPSTSDYRSICKRGWKRYSLGKTSLPGTRYSFTKKSENLKPHNIGVPLGTGEEYAFERAAEFATNDHGMRAFEGDYDNPGYDQDSNDIFCAEACMKMSNVGFVEWPEAPTWKIQNDQNSPITAFMASRSNGRCYCQESFIKPSEGATLRNIAVSNSLASSYNSWQAKPVKKEFLRRKEFAGGDPPWECHLHIVSAGASTFYSSEYTPQKAIDNVIADISGTYVGQNTQSRWVTAFGDTNIRLDLHLASGIRSIASVKIWPSYNDDRIEDFKLQYKKAGEGTWTDCGTYSYAGVKNVPKTFPCDVTSDVDIAAVRIHKINSGYMDIAEVKVQAPCGTPTIVQTTYDAYLTPGSLDDMTGRSRKCGEMCKSINMQSFTVNVETGHCACFPNRWDAFGNDPFYNSYTKLYFRNDKRGTEVLPSRHLPLHHYEIIRPKNYRNMHYGKGRYCGTVGSTQQVTGSYVQRQEACYELCQNSMSFVLDENGNCGCQETSAICDTFSGVTLTEREWVKDDVVGLCTDIKKIGDFECGSTEHRVYAGCGSSLSGGDTNTYPDGTSTCDGSTQKRIDECGAACKIAKPTWPGFAISASGRCYCEYPSSASCSRSYGGYKRYDFQTATTVISQVAYDKYDAPLDEQKRRCASECANKGDFNGFVLPIGGGSGECRCHNRGSDCSNTAGWQGYKFEMECTGDTYEHVSYSTCVSICMDASCSKFSYSGQKCVICSGSNYKESRVESSRIYQVSNRNTYQQFEVLNESPSTITPPHLGVPLFQKFTLEIADGYKNCDMPFKLITMRSCGDLDGETVASKIGCEAALAALGHSVTVTEVSYISEPPGCYYDTNDNKGKFNTETGIVEASLTKQSVCELPLLKLTKEQCQKYAEQEGLPFEAEEDKPEFDFMCHVDLDDPTYYIQNGGTCDEYITTLQECEAARVSVGVGSVAAAMLSNSNLPRGCINSGTFTKLNTASTTKYCGYAGYPCICKRAQDGFVSWTPFKTTGICLENSFSENLEFTETYNYESFTNSPCMGRECEKVNYKWTKRSPGCAYKDDWHTGGIMVTNKGRLFPMNIENCVDACVDMLTQGKLGQVHTGVHEIIINRLRGTESLLQTLADNDENSGIRCECLPLTAARFCNSDPPIDETGVSGLRSGGAYYGMTALPSSNHDIHSITVTAEIKCNYASVFRSFKEFERSVVTFQNAVDECFKACVSGSLFHRGTFASVGDMNINGFRVEKGTYSNQLRASCECVEIPETPEECDIKPVYTLRGTTSGPTNPTYEAPTSNDCITGYEYIRTEAECRAAATSLGRSFQYVSTTNVHKCSSGRSNDQVVFWNTYATPAINFGTYYWPICISKWNVQDCQTKCNGDATCVGIKFKDDQCVLLTSIEVGSGDWEVYEKTGTPTYKLIDGVHHCSEDTDRVHMNNYYLRENGACEEYITTNSECSQAAAVLGISHQGSSDKTGQNYMQGCLFHGSGIIFNSGSGGDCSSNAFSCVCKAVPITAPLDHCKDTCNEKDGCDGFSLYQGNNGKIEYQECIFANKGCGKMTSYADFRYESYVKEDVETFQIFTASSFEVNKAKYTISSIDEDGSPVFFPKDEFIPQEKEEWYTHLDFTKYSIHPDCTGKEPVFDDECTHAMSLLPKWQSQTCPTGFTHIDDFCQKVEEIPNTKCVKEYTVNEDVIINITFSGTNGNEDYLVSDGDIEDVEDPNLVVCTTFQVFKSFVEHPLNIKNTDGVDVAENILTTSLTLQPGLYTYYCTSHPNFMLGTLRVNDCSPKPLFTEVSGNCPQECSRLATKGHLGYHSLDEKQVLTHYASDCKCHTTMMTDECSFANNTETSDKTLYKIMTTSVNKCINDNEMICKEAPEEKSDNEEYICISDENIKVFDANEQCVVCGGGEHFDIGSVFFNENGDTSTCTYTEETSVCDEQVPGWSQYQIRSPFMYYKKVENGYCENFKDTELDFSEMILSEMVESCATACMAYDIYSGFSISRTQCFCTVLNCETRIGDFDTFEYMGDRDNKIDVSEIVQKWNSNAPGLRCFKDLDHSDEAPCDWIRALKHFARGGSYRIGDCHNLAPGTDIETQIPCNGHGFPSAGVCACDYAENFELRSSGVGLTFESPNLRQTPFRGKACQYMCPGYDMYNMESVCSGHGRCETDGRCSCEQGFTGYNCQLACETETKALTCSGHGVCNERQQPLRKDIVELLNTLECKNETLYLARDRVIRVDDVIHYMYKSLDGLSIDSFVVPNKVTIDFKSSDTSYTISVDGGEDEENPIITVCETFQVVKSFTGEPFNIRKNSGEVLVYNWDQQQQQTFTTDPGRYEYISVNSPLTHRGFIDVKDCKTKSTRIASINDFYIRGESVRRPFSSVSDFPYMPCKDRINITRETAFHPLIEHTTPDVTSECSLLGGYQDSAYTLLCGMCQCEESQATGFWTGYDCRTPSEGYYGSDGRDACPGLTADKKPCNGGGTCTWGTVNGLGKITYADAQCFCGDTTLDSTYATAPRNLAGDMMFHVMNFDDALYVETLDVVDGNNTECFYGTIPLNFQECQHDWVSNGGVEEIVSEAAVVSDVRNDVVLDFESSCDLPGTMINQVKTEEILLLGNKREQKMKCAGACFGEYRFSFNGRCPMGGVLVLSKDTNPGATWDEKSMHCAQACRSKFLPIVGEWSNTANPGFSINQNGECVCDALFSCTQVTSAEWKHFDFVTPYKFVRTGSNTGIEREIGPPVGDTDNEKLVWCASMCQHFTFDDQTISKGFLYTSSNPTSCVCQGGSDDNILNDGRDRYDYTHFSGFTVEYDTSCKCEVEELCTPGLRDAHRFKILGDITPMLYTLEQRVSIFDGAFICLKDDLIQCKGGPLMLTNYNQHDCSCKFGFTGNTCEIPRMMCIFAGQETDGTSCTCNSPKVRSSGCCTNGLYWDQIRYSSFSPLVDFDAIPDNIFYYDALKSVCKPGPMKLKSTSEGADAVKIHNYAALTDEFYITNPAICNFPTELPIYKAVYKYNGAVSGPSTITITKEEVRSLGYEYDEFFDKYVEQYAKDRCLYRCTRRKVDEDPFKSFHLLKRRTNLAEDTFLIGDNTDEMRTFDASANGHKNPGNLNSNTIEPDEIEYCRKSCTTGPQSTTSSGQNTEFLTQHKATHFAIRKDGSCSCFASLGGQISTASLTGYERYSMVPDIEYDCTCSVKPAFVGGNSGDDFVEPIFKADQKVYDIVYPMDKEAALQNIDCFQAAENLKHVDIQVKTAIDEMTGMPSSITPATLNIKGTRVKKNANNFHQCYKACHAESSQITANSFIWGRKPQVPIVFAGNPVQPYTKLKHCWSHCNTNTDCETGLKCVVRARNDQSVYAWPGCVEPENADRQWGSGGTLSNTDNICYDPTSLEDECYCTVHDPDEPPCVNSFELMGPGYCSNKRFLSIGSYPPVLDEDNILYDADKRTECMNRCLAEYPDSKTFFTKTIDGEERCACAHDYCAERLASSPYLSYRIEFCDTNIRDGFLMEEHTDYYKVSTPKMIVADDVEYEDAMPVNPYTCGLESIVHQGDIVSSSCECPLNIFEEVFVQYEYKALTQKGTCHYYWSKAGNLQECEALCDSSYGCNSFSHDGGACWLSVDCHHEWDVRAFAPFFCYGPTSQTWASSTSSTTPEKCAENAGTNQFGFNSDTNQCYKYNEEYTNMDDCTKADGTAYQTSLHPLEAVNNGGAYTAYAYRNSITQILEGKNRNDWYYGDLSTVSYVVLQEPRYEVSSKTRYIKQVKADTKDHYCTVGEEEVYSADISDTIANDHSCMQKCRQEFPNLDFVIARGAVQGDIFHCLCSDFNPDVSGSGCGIGTPNTFKGDKQYKVSNTPVSSCKCPGFYIFDGQAISCPPGRYSSEDDPCMSSCKLCPSGRFSQVGYTECESCPAGKIQQGLSCTDCAAGKSSPAGIDECFTCALGLYTQTKGTPSCFECPNGYYDNDSQDGLTCKSCPAGYYAGLATKITCSECPQGTYGDSMRMGSCKRCSIGKYQPGTAMASSSQCKNCDTGKYQNQQGQGSCKNCAYGKFQSQTGRTGCIGCYVGMYQNQYGQSSCKNCPTGRYGSETGSSSCSACPIGKYQDQNGKTICKNCGTGKYNDQTAQSSSSGCHNCPSGRYNPYTGRSDCVSCGSLHSGYSWSNSPDRITDELSCDSYKTDLPSAKTMWDSNTYWCKTYMAGHTGGKGDMWRRDCIMGGGKPFAGGEGCNEYACDWYSDCTNSWYAYYPSKWRFDYYCKASRANQYD